MTRLGVSLLLIWVTSSCDEPAGDDVATAAAAGENVAPGTREDRNPYLEPPVNIPVPYRPPRRSGDSDPAASTGGGGGGSRSGGRGDDDRGRGGLPPESQRFVDGLEAVPESEYAALLARSRAAAQQTDPADGCARMYASLEPLFARADAAPISEEAFMRQCGQMPPELKTCLQAPEERTPAESERCRQVLGTAGDIFGSDAVGWRPDPRRDERLTAERRAEARRMGQRATRLVPGDG